MSFILDALRKSENERQQDAIPNVARVPLAVPRNKVPAWALVLMSILGLGVIALGGAWWQNLPRQVPAAAEAAPVAAGPARTAGAGAPDAPAATGPTVAPGSTAANARAPTREAIPLSQLVEPARAASTPPPAAGEARAVAQPQAAPQVAASARQRAVNAPRSSLNAPEISLPTAAELMADGISVPLLELQLHGYSDDPGQRFVFINGSKYQEGETLSEGPRLLHISTSGAVLSHQGTEFRLLRE